MAFTYDLTNSNATTAAIARVRLEIGDTVAGAGPRPHDKNFSDAEIQTYLTATANDINATVYAMLQILSAEWSRAFTRSEGTTRLNYSQIAQSYREQIKLMIDSGKVSPGQTFSVTPQRNDGYAAETDTEYTS